MLRRETRPEVSVRSFGGLIRANSTDAARKETEYRFIIKAMEKGDFSSMKKLGQIVRQLIQHDLEGIKLYAEKDEYGRIALFEKFMHFILKSNLDDETRKKLKKDAKEITDSLKDEMKNEKRMKRGGRPHAGLLNLFRDERKLAKKTRKQSKHLAGIESRLDNEVSLITKLARAGRPDQLRQAVIRLSADFMEFFDTILEIEKETEMQEFGITRQLMHLQKVAKKHDQMEAQDKLEELINEVKSYYKKDFLIAKREYKYAQKLAA